MPFSARTTFLPSKDYLFIRFFSARSIVNSSLSNNSCRPTSSHFRRLQGLPDLQLEVSNGTGSEDGAVSNFSGRRHLPPKMDCHFEEGERRKAVESTKENRIMIVGDFLIFRNGLKLLLSSESSFVVVGEATDLAEAARTASKICPDILLIDSAEFDSGDFDAFASSLPVPLPILVLTNSRHTANHQKYLELGISGVFSKEKSAESLFKAIKQVCSGELWFQRKLIVDTILQLVKEKKALPDHLYSYNCAVLTGREREVLSLICRGMKNKAIADSLFITETTVRHHLTSIFEKLKVSSRLELVVHAFNEKLVEIPDGNGHVYDRVFEANLI